MPAADRCSAVTPPARHAVSLPYELRDAREPPLCSAARSLAWSPRSRPKLDVLWSASALRGLPGELDAEVVADVDLGVLGEPGAGGHVLKHRCQSLIDGPGEVDDAPLVQRLQLAAANRVLDVEQRLPGACVQRRPVRSGQLGHAEEGDLLLAVLAAGAFQDQPVPVWGEPQPLHRAAVEVLAAVAVVAAPGAVAASL